MNMKRFLILVLVGIVGFLAYNQIPSLHMSEDEKNVHALEKRFISAKTEFQQAGRMAGMSGVDSTSQAQAAITTVRKINKELQALRRSLSDESAIERADGLASSISSFLKG